MCCAKAGLLRNTLRCCAKPDWLRSRSICCALPAPQTGPTHPAPAADHPTHLPTRLPRRHKPPGRPPPLPKSAGPPVNTAGDATLLWRDGEPRPLLRSAKRSFSSLLFLFLLLLAEP